MTRRIAPWWFALRTLIGLVALSCGSDDSSVGPSSTGQVQVTVSLTGDDLPAVYAVSVSGRSSLNNRVGTPAALAGIPPGEHSVRIDISPNCQVVGDNPRRATVARGETTVVAFAVTCSATTRSLQLVTSTTGEGIDPDGYTVVVEGAVITGGRYHRRISVTPTGETTLAAAPTGPLHVTLVGLAVNCNALGTNPLILPAATATTVVSLSISCGPATARIAYVHEHAQGTDLRVVDGNGTVLNSITSDAYLDADPAWSPDGERLAFSTNRDGNREIYAIDPDGSNAVRLTDDPNDDYSPAWSPDGRRIAFTRSVAASEDIFVMNADGTRVERLTTDGARDGSPTWSTDGQTIAFMSERDTLPEIYTMSASGGTQTRVTLGGGRHAAWSPDGTKLAFAVPICGADGCVSSIFTKTGAQEPVPVSHRAADRPSWSPDGRRMVVDMFICDFYSYDCDRDGVYIMTLDGTDAVFLAKGHSAVWAPR